MTRSSPILRAARPTDEDGQAFGRYLDTAAEGFFRFWLGRRYADILARAFVQPGHDLSHENVTFAERSGLVVGMVSGYTAAEHRRSSLAPLELAAGRSRLRMKTVSILCAPMLRIIDTIDEGDFYLQAVAVDAEQRGEGIGATLLTRIEERAMAEGCHRLVLDVSARNTRAQSLYARRGMTIESRWPRLRVLPPLFVRMVKSLECR